MTADDVHADADRVDVAARASAAGAPTWHVDAVERLTLALQRTS